MAANQTPLDEATYVAVDLETTGLNHRTEHIIEIGAVKMVGGVAIETFSQLVNPNRLVPIRITKLTGITSSMVSGAPDIKDALLDFSDFARDSILVAHNAPFDLSFLNRAARSTGQKMFRQRHFDTKLIAQKLNPLLGFYRLENLVEHFGGHARPCHRALPDALATAEVFAQLIEIMKEAGLNTIDKAGEFFYPREHYDFSDKKQLAKVLPRSNGVYLMKNSLGEIIYVGKAKDLNKRVRSYFYSGPKTDRQLGLLTEIKSIDHIKTGTEIGALLLENQLIKKYRPTYNVLGKRYRRYPFVHIDFADEFPTPKIVKKVSDRGYHYGPFSNTPDVELLLQVTKDLYGLKQCDYKILARPNAKDGNAPAKLKRSQKGPCFYYQVNRCSGPCAGMISQQAYHKKLSAVTEAFDGYPEKLKRELIRRRDNASERLLFERAALLNRALNSLERTVKLLEGIRNAKANLDFLLLEDLNDKTKVYVVEDGQLRSCLDIKNTKDKARDIARLEKKLTKTYFEKQNLLTLKGAQITPDQIENLSLLTSYFYKKPVVRVTIGKTAKETISKTLKAMRPAPSTEKDGGLSLQLLS